MHTGRPASCACTLFLQSGGLKFLPAYAWARQHPGLVRKIVQASTEFAEKHLTQKGLECYTMRLLHTYSMLQEDSDAVAHMLEQAWAKFPAT